MERHFAKNLAELNGRLIAMGQIAQEMIQTSVQALVERRAELIEEVLKKESAVNRMQIEIDETALKLLATQQPVAADLRFLVTAMKLNAEIERIADQAVNVAENTQELLKHPPLKPLIDIPMMAELAIKMVKDSLDAFVRHDEIASKGIIMMDDKVDALKDQVFRELLTYMLADANAIPRAISLLLISRNLERVGDQATNIAEEVIYMVKGLDVRHPHNYPDQSPGNG